jgi:hypothetical protein
VIVTVLSSLFVGLWNWDVGCGIEYGRSWDIRELIEGLLSRWDEVNILV